MLATFILYAFLSGLMLSLGWLSWSTPAFLPVAFVPLWIAAYKLIRSGARRSYGIMLLLSYIVFLVWNIVDTMWLKNSTTGGFFAAAIANATFMTLVMMVSYFVVRRRGFVLGLVFWVALWLSFEKLHTDWEFAWPMLTLGNGFARYADLVQWYEYTGVFGGSLWVLAVNVLAFFAWKSYVERRPRSVFYRRTGIAVAVLLVPLLISWAVTPRGAEKGEEIQVIALQPNIDPYKEKFSYATDQGMVDTLRTMCDTLLSPQVKLVAAPETYLPEYKPLEVGPQCAVFDTLRAFSLQHGGLTLVTGTSFVRYIYDRDSVTATANKVRNQDVWYDVYNSAVQVTPEGFTRYDKSKLVPGVERFPYRKYLEGVLGDLTIDMGGMSGSNVTQSERGVFVSLGGKMRLAPIICYESIFGEFVTGYVEKGANVLCIITNDGWWGNTEGHRQLLWISRLRAIETRLPVVRSANTGVSAFIAPDGRITAVLPYGVKGALKGSVVLAERQPTFYVRHGDYIARGAVAVAGILLVFSLVPFRKKK